MLSQRKRDNEATICSENSTGLIWNPLYGWLLCLTSADWIPHLVLVVTHHTHTHTTLPESCRTTGSQPMVWFAWKPDEGQMLVQK